MCGVGPVVIIERDPPTDPGPGFAPARKGVQVNAFVFQGPPQSFDEDIVEEPTIAIHGDPYTGFFQTVGPGP